MSEQEKQELFISIVERWEWHKMTPQYLQDVVLLHEYVRQNTELRLAILQDALSKLEYRRRINTCYSSGVGRIPVKYRDEAGDRAHTTFTTYVTPQEIKEAQSKPLIKGFAVLAGVPWIIKVEKVAADSDQAGLAQVVVCPCFRNTRDDCVAGLCIGYRIKVGVLQVRTSGERVFHPENGLAWVGMVAKPSRTWDVFFGENSQYIDKEKGLPVELMAYFV
jgi:hypothetical protein